MMRTEGSLLRKIWKPFDWILLWLEKYWQILIGRWRKESERGRKKVTIEDVIKKSILPLAFMLFWFWMVSTIMKVSGQTDLFWWIFLSGLPFGIHKMRLILIPKGMDITATLGMAALSVIIGACISSGYRSPVVFTFFAIWLIFTPILCISSYCFFSGVVSVLTM